MAIFLRESTSIITVDASDVLKDTTKTEFYYMVGDKEYKIPIDGAKVVYNGQVKNVTAEELAPDVGTVRLISNNRGGDYDTILVESYTDYVVKNVNYDNDTVYFTDGSSMILDISDASVSTSITDSTGKEIEAYDLYPEDILSIAESDKYRKVWRSNRITEGAVTEKTDDYFVINGEKYTVSKAFREEQSLETIELGTDFIFYLNFMGKIVTAEKYRDYMYGYLVNASPVGGLDKKPYLKIYTEEKEMVVYDTADRVMLNGESISKKDILHESKANEIWDGSGAIRQLLRYETDGQNRLVKIETATDHTKNAEAAEADEGFSLD